MKKGFTLIELLGVIVIIGIIALIAVPAVDSTIKKGKQKAYDMTKDTIIGAAKNWLTDNKALFDDGDILTLTLSDLKEQGYLDFDIRNPSSGACLDSTMQVSVARSGKKYNYAIVGDELVDGTETDCGAVGRAPSIYLLGSNPFNVEINATFTDPGAKATDTDGNDISNKIITSGIVDTSVLADSIKYKYTVLSDGITKTTTRKINVVDTTKPVLVGADDITIFTTDTTFDIMNGVSSTDNSGSTVTIKTKSNLTLGVIGQYKVTYIATDPSGNTTTKIRNIKVTRPEYTIVAQSNGNYLWNDTYRSKIESINFIDHVDTTGAAISWDLSAAQNGKITGWLMTDTDNPSYYKMYIGSTGDIYASPNSSSWFSQLTSLYSIKFDNFNTSNVTNMSYMFDHTSALTSLDLNSFDTSNVTNMANMFDHASGLTSLDLINFNTSKVSNMGNMFYNASGLTSLNLSNFDTSQVINMSAMFYNASGLTSLNLSHFNTSNVTNMMSMFYGAGGLTSLNLSNFNTSKVTNMGDMFCWARGLTSLDLSNFDTSQVTSMGGMFEYASGLTSLNLSSFNTSNVTSMGSMFKNTSGLTSLDLSIFNTLKVTNMVSMFNGATKLITIYAGSNWITTGATTTDMFTGCGTSTVTLK